MLTPLSACFRFLSLCISPMVQPVRLMASSMTGEFLRTDAYVEYPDPITGMTKQFCSISRDEQICLMYAHLPTPPPPLVPSLPLTSHLPLFLLPFQEPVPRVEQHPDPPCLGPSHRLDLRLRLPGPHRGVAHPEVGPLAQGPRRRLPRPHGGQDAREGATRRPSLIIVLSNVCLGF